MRRLMDVLKSLWGKIDEGEISFHNSAYRVQAPALEGVW
jgi:hypothetical protein